MGEVSARTIAAAKGTAHAASMKKFRGIMRPGHPMCLVYALIAMEEIVRNRHVISTPIVVRGGSDGFIITFLYHELPKQQFTGREPSPMMRALQMRSSRDIRRMGC
jgi:hypothetical protein